MVIEELKNSIRNDILEELKVEIRTNFKTLIDAVPKTPIPGPRQFSFNSAKRKRDNDDTGSNPSKLLRGTDAAGSLTPSIAVNREDKKFWLYLSGISPDVPDESVTKLAADKLGNSNITVVKLVSRGRDPRTLNFVSYKVGMPTDLKEKAMTASTWSVAIAYREFEEKSDSRKVFWKPNAPDSATMTASTALRPPPKRSYRTFRAVSFRLLPERARNENENTRIPSSASSDYDVIVLTETWLREDILNAELSSNYVIYRCDRNSTTSQLPRGGGVLIAVKNNLVGSQLSLSGIERLEQIAVRIALPNQSVYISCVYLRPNSDPDLYHAHANVVEEFVYLGSLVTADNDTSREIRRRIVAGNRAYFGLRKTLRSNRVRRRTKLTIYKTLIRPVVLYGHETWTMLVEDQRALGVFERKVLRTIYGGVQMEDGE
ncbi:uncharacterized protein LOC131676058 [Topomyia yanbarensis]|uniref:uncharacterized protein LOC131676058 n=1 Tax=Topomyia yanbarensis TaxID=2498891 RepID=UPI00273ADAA3|nr:uncharacterized protein LOC131676058 [Topomyia yanbarensis]